MPLGHSGCSLHLEPVWPRPLCRGRGSPGLGGGCWGLSLCNQLSPSLLPSESLNLSCVPGPGSFERIQGPLYPHTCRFEEELVKCLRATSGFVAHTRDPRFGLVLASACCFFSLQGQLASPPRAKCCVLTVAHRWHAGVCGPSEFAHAHWKLNLRRLPPARPLVFPSQQRCQSRVRRQRSRGGLFSPSVVGSQAFLLSVHCRLCRLSRGGPRAVLPSRWLHPPSLSPPSDTHTRLLPIFLPLLRLPR